MDNEDENKTYNCNKKSISPVIVSVDEQESGINEVNERMNDLI